MLGFGAGQALTIGNNKIEIGSSGQAAESNTIRIGTQGIQKQTYIAGIGGAPVTGSEVVVNASGRAGSGGIFRALQARRPRHGRG